MGLALTLLDNECHHVRDIQGEGSWEQGERRGRRVTTGRQKVLRKAQENSSLHPHGGWHGPETWPLALFLLPFPGGPHHTLQSGRLGVASVPL
jgi:hypothetical protein